MHFMRHSHFVRFEQVRALLTFFVQHLHWYVLCVCFSRTSPSSRHVPAGGQVLLQYLARITFKSSARHPSKKEHPTVSLRLTKSSPSSNSLSELMSSQNRLAHGVAKICKSPFVRRARVFVQTCFAQKLPPTLAGEKGRPSDFALPFFFPSPGGGF